MALLAEDLESSLQWYIDIGWDEPMDIASQDRLDSVSLAPVKPVVMSSSPVVREPLGAAEAKISVAPLLDAVKTLDALKAALNQFDGMAIRKTATNLVFGDGNPAASLMVIGEVPDAEDDRQGRAFSGEAGQLLDKMMAAIGLSREAENQDQSVYLTQVLNWRPPGNRSPHAVEIDLSLPFLQKHIDLIQPQFLLLMGSVPAKALLGARESMAKLRGQWFDYQSIPCLVTYPPSFLLKSPAKKRESWEDLQKLQAKMFDGK